MPEQTTERRRRFLVVLIIALLLIGGAMVDTIRSYKASKNITTAVQPVLSPGDPTLAAVVLEKLPVKGRAPKTGYSRKQFSDGWAKVGACDMRNHILTRDMTEITYRSATDCTVLSGTLDDPYTGKIIHFSRGANSAAVQIDHIVAISNAWQTGAQALTPAMRLQMYNDPLELIAGDGPANNDKGDSDAASWLPPNKPYRCRYVARQIAVKAKYSLWVTTGEHDAMKRTLDICPNQVVPLVETIVP